MSRHALTAVPMAAGWVSALHSAYRRDRASHPVPEGKRKEEEKVESKEALGINPIIVVTQKKCKLQASDLQFF